MAATSNYFKILGAQLLQADREVILNKIIIVYLLWTELYVWEAVGSVSGRAFVITRWHVFTVSNYDIILIWKQTIPEIIKRKIDRKSVV